MVAPVGLFLELRRLQLSYLSIVWEIFSAILARATGLSGNSVKISVAVLGILSVSASVVSSKQPECSAYWLKMWNSRSETQRWAYVDLAYYAKFGAHPKIPGYSSTEISLYLAALAIKNKQGLELFEHSISLEAMDRSKRAGSMRYVIARHFGLRLPTLDDDNRPDRCVFSQSSVCLERLVRPLLPKAEKIQQFLESAARSDQLGEVPCEGGIQYFDRPRFR